MDTSTLVVVGVVVVLALIIVFSSLRIANEYERGVVFRLGRLIALKGPGLFFIIPFGVDRLVKIDLRVITLEVPPQEVITNDNVTAKVNAVIYFQVVDAQRAVTQVLNYINATSQIAQTTLRAALGQATLDELLANRAKIINADGEYQASQTLANAAQIISTQQGALQLRFLQTLVEIGTEKNTTIVLPIPIELFKPILEATTSRPAAPGPTTQAPALNPTTPKPG